MQNYFEGSPTLGVSAFCCGYERALLQPASWPVRAA